MTTAVAPGIVGPSTVESTPAGQTRADIRSFVDRVVAPRAAEFDRSGAMDPEVLAAVADRGWWGAVIGKKAGGTGTGMVDLALLHEEFGRGCSSLRSLLTVHSMVLHAVHRWGTAPARERWFSELVDGSALGAFCLTEPQAGSDFTGLEAAAVPSADGFSITGTKLWVTGGQIADVLLVFARTPRGPSAFVVPANAPGVTRIPVPDMLGIRGSQLAEIRFSDVRVDRATLIGPEGMGLSIATDVLDIGRLSVAAGSVGIIQACLEACAHYAGRRTQGGTALSGHQLIQQMVATMAVDVRAARLLCWQAATLKDQRDPGTLIATCMAKQFAATRAVAAANDAVQLHGALGCSGQYPVARYLRDAKVMEIIEGSTQAQHVLIAKYAFARPDQVQDIS